MAVSNYTTYLCAPASFFHSPAQLSEHNKCIKQYQEGQIKISRLSSLQYTNKCYYSSCSPALGQLRKRLNDAFHGKTHNSHSTSASLESQEYPERSNTISACDNIEEEKIMAQHERFRHAQIQTSNSNRNGPPEDPYTASLGI